MKSSGARGLSGPGVADVATVFAALALRFHAGVQMMTRMRVFAVGRRARLPGFGGQRSVGLNAADRRREFRRAFGWTPAADGVRRRGAGCC